MRFIISAVFFLSLCTFVMGQRFSRTDSIGIVNKKFDDWNNGWEIKETIKWYRETTSNGVVIQSSFPKGGAYTDSSGKTVGGYRIFFYRVTNETAIPLELTINFPADSFAIPYLTDSYVKLFLPPDTMSLNKELLYGYGLDLHSFLDAGPDNPTMLQRTINPDEECLFYIVVLTEGVVRAELVLKDHDLFYSITPHLDLALIPCGHVIAKK